MVLVSGKGIPVLFPETNTVSIDYQGLPRAFGADRSRLTAGRKDWAEMVTGQQIIDLAPLMVALQGESVLDALLVELVWFECDAQPHVTLHLFGCKDKWHIFTSADSHGNMRYCDYVVKEETAEWRYLGDFVTYFLPLVRKEVARLNGEKA